MTGSVLTKSTEPAHTYAGVPAKDITDKLCCWKNITDSEKRELLLQFINEFIVAHPQYKGKIIFEDDFNRSLTVKDEEKIIVRNNIFSIDMQRKYISYFDYHSKLYTKKRTKIEIDFIKFNIGYRARFIPF